MKAGDWPPPLPQSITDSAPREGWNSRPSQARSFSALIFSEWPALPARQPRPLRAALPPRRSLYPWHRTPSIDHVPRTDLRPATHPTSMVFLQI